MTRQNQFGGRTRPRQDRLLEEKVHDTYRTDEKVREPTHCADCGVVYGQGRWHWAEAEAGSSESRCPACRRIRDDYPGGYVTLSGTFLDEHRPEIVNLIDNTEAQAKSEHPMQRLMGVRDTEDGVEVRTTDMHLARAIGEALHRAYQGEMDYKYNKGDDLLRVTWSRDV